VELAKAQRAVRSLDYGMDKRKNAMGTLPDTGECINYWVLAMECLRYLLKHNIAAHVVCATMPLPYESLLSASLWASRAIGSKNRRLGARRYKCISDCIGGLEWILTQGDSWNANGGRREAPSILTCTSGQWPNCHIAEGGRRCRATSLPIRI
jgi:hypothetical protein